MAYSGIWLPREFAVFNIIVVKNVIESKALKTGVLPSLALLWREYEENGLYFGGNFTYSID